MRSLLVLAVVSLLVLVALGGCGKKKEEVGLITPETIARVKTGMTYEEVVAVFGTPGTEGPAAVPPKAGVKVAADTTKTYDWKNTSTTAVRAVFNDNKLISTPTTIPLAVSAVKDK
ncbi:MAG: outer membrane protein assembly factor BamE domain-containing protein [Armatimonadota bacterium]